MIVAQPVLFVVLLPEPSPTLVTRILQEFPDGNLQVTPTQWFIVTTGTALELSGKLGITDGSAGAAIILAVASYYGRANMSIWGWIAAKIGAPTVAAP